MSITLRWSEHIALIKGAFKKRFPKTTFYFDHSKYSMGSSLNVTYVDGPALTETRALLDSLNGFSWNGHEDLNEHRTFEYDGKSYRGGVPTMAIDREYSSDRLTPAIRALMAERGIPENSGPIPTKDTDLVIDAIKQLSALSLPEYRAPKAALSLSELKRRLVVGLRLRTTRSDGTVREGVIVHVQTNAIAIGPQPGTPRKDFRWLPWPPSRRVQIPAVDRFDIRNTDGEITLSVEILGV